MRPDDQVGRAGFIFERHERDSLGGSRALSAREPIRRRDSAGSAFKSCSAAAGHDVLGIQRLAQWSERMAPQRQSLGMIVMDDFLRRRKPR